jgi:hypothetical protein
LSVKVICIFNSSCDRTHLPDRPVGRQLGILKPVFQEFSQKSTPLLWNCGNAAALWTKLCFVVCLFIFQEKVGAGVRNSFPACRSKIRAEETRTGSHRQLAPNTPLQQPQPKPNSRPRGRSVPRANPLRLLTHLVPSRSSVITQLRQLPRHRRHIMSIARASSNQLYMDLARAAHPTAATDTHRAITIHQLSFVASSAKQSYI